MVWMNRDEQELRLDPPSEFFKGFFKKTKGDFYPPQQMGWVVVHPRLAPEQNCTCATLGGKISSDYF